MRVIAVSNSKGGVGKTTTAVTVAHGLALRGHRVLIVDLDAQGSAGHALGLGGSFKRTTFDLLVSNRSVEECVVKARKHLWLLPSDVGMAEAKDRIVAQAAVRAVASMARGRRGEVDDPTITLVRAMKGAADFDYVLLDCAPGVDIMVANALMYAHEVIMPVSVDYLSTVGAGQHVQSVVEAQIQGASVYISVVLPTFYERNTHKAQVILGQLREHFGRIVAEPIPKGVKVAEAPAYGQTLWEYAPKSKPAAAYRALIERIEHAQDTA